MNSIFKLGLLLFITLISLNLQAKYIKGNLIQKAEDEILKSNFTGAIKWVTE
jgi:hypothetical protein